MRAFSDCPNDREVHGRSRVYTCARTVCYSNADSSSIIKSGISRTSSASRHR